MDSIVYGAIGPELIKHHAMQETIARWRHVIGTARTLAVKLPHAARIQQLGKTLRANVVGCPSLLALGYLRECGY